MGKYSKGISNSMDELDKYWQDFLVATKRDMSTLRAGDMSFDDSLGTSNTANAKVASILCGKKTAVFSALDTFNIEGEAIPVSGELYIVVDAAGKARCVVELQSVAIVPFMEVTNQMVLQEGEDDNVVDWRLKMREYLQEEGDIVGFQFTQAMKLVYQVFRVVYR